MGKRKLLYIIEHCSTGGMPQYTLKQIETFKDEYDIYVVELNYFGPDYVVQREKIKRLVHFQSLEGKHKKLFEVIKDINPDMIHIQENPSGIMNTSTCNALFKDSRDYFILATTHSSLTKKEDWKYVPDRIVAVNRWQKQQFEGLTDVDIWEYPIESKGRLDGGERWKLRRKLGFPSETGTSGCGLRHVLNVGLFTPGKNQGELFEVARKKLESYDECYTYYHFVGNQAVNFKDYWEPLMANKPANCIVWGERDDVDLFYQVCDEFYFTSKLELNPICIKEALSYGLPVKMYKLPTYLDDYDNNQLVTYL